MSWASSRMLVGDAPAQQLEPWQHMSWCTLRFRDAELERTYGGNVSDRQLRWDGMSAVCAALFQVTFFLYSVRSREDPDGQLKMRTRHLLLVGSARALPALSLATVWAAARVARRPTREVYQRVRPFYVWFFRVVAICVWGGLTASMAASHRARTAAAADSASGGLGGGGGGGDGHGRGDAGAFWFSTGACTQVVSGMTQALVTPLMQMSMLPMQFQKAFVMQLLLVAITCAAVVMPGGFLDQLSHGTAAAAAAASVAGGAGTCGAAPLLGSSSIGSTGSTSNCVGDVCSSMFTHGTAVGAVSGQDDSNSSAAASLVLQQMAAAASAEWSSRCGPILAAALRLSRAVAGATHALTLLSGPAASNVTGVGDGRQHSVDMCTLRVTAGGFITAAVLALPLWLLYRSERSSRVAWLKQRGLLPQAYADRSARASAWEACHSLLLAVALGANVWAAVHAGVCGGAR